MITLGGGRNRLLKNHFLLEVKNMEQQNWAAFGADYIAEHFGENRPLAVQQAVQNIYRKNPIPLPRMIATHLDLTGAESVLDIGCGNGLILREVAPLMNAGGRFDAVDISPEMVALAQKAVAHHWGPVTVQHGDAYRVNEMFENAFDRVMANFIFHYIDHPETFCRTMSEVTAPDGLAIVTVEGRFSMPEMYLLHEIAMMRAGFSEEDIRAVPYTRRGTVTLENAAEYLRPHFRRVQEIPYVDHLTFQSVDAFMEFYRDGHRCCGLARSLGQRGEDAMDTVAGFVRKDVERRIGDFGFFELSKRISIFVCRDPAYA